jgi:hypothetical protein
MMFNFVTRHDKHIMTNCVYINSMNERLKIQVQNLSTALVEASSSVSRNPIFKNSVGTKFDFIQYEFENVGSQYKKFEIKRRDDDGEYLRSSGKVVILTITKDRMAFGCAGTRGVEDYLEMIQKFDYPASKMSLSILTNSVEEYESFKAVMNAIRFDNMGYQSIKLFHRLSTLQLQHINGENVDLKRKNSFQKDRRREIARQRNFLVSVGVENEDSVLWIDADVVNIQPGTLKKFVASGKDIIVTNTVNGPKNEPFDANTWVGARKKPTAAEREKIAQGGLFVPGATKDTKYLWDLVHVNEDFVEIDSVGGTVLYVKANVFREGVIFPTQYIIGAEWDYEGYDGIETEGLCYLAKYIGYKCWGMPHELAWHHVGCERGILNILEV